MLVRKDIETALEYMESQNLVRLSRITGTWYTLYCPFHNNGQEKKPSCGCALESETRNGITYNPGRFHCFSCGASYSFENGVREILSLKGTSFEAHPSLKKYVDNNSERSDENSLIPPELYTAVMSKYAAEDIRSKMLATNKQHVSEEELASYRFTVPYMYQRRLTDAVIEKYDVGFDGNFIPPGRKKPLPCVTFPVRDMTGRTLFFCRRSIEGKFFNYPQGVEKPVYGIYELPQDCKEVIICESVFNALTSVVYGHPAVALLGTGNSMQIQQLKQLGVSSYIICLDNDDAGRKGAAKLKKALSKSGFVWIMTVPNEWVKEDGSQKDINDLTKEEFMECYNNKE